MVKTWIRFPYSFFSQGLPFCCLLICLLVIHTIYFSDVFFPVQSETFSFVPKKEQVMSWVWSLRADSALTRAI